MFLRSIAKVWSSLRNCAFARKTFDLYEGRRMTIFVNFLTVFYIVILSSLPDYDLFLPTTPEKDLIHFFKHQNFSLTSTHNKLTSEISCRKTVWHKCIIEMQEVQSRAGRTPWFDRIPGSINCA